MGERSGRKGNTRPAAHHCSVPKQVSLEERILELKLNAPKNKGKRKKEVNKTLWVKKKRKERKL